MTSQAAVADKAVTATFGVGPRLFAGAADEERARRVSDGIVFAFALIALGATSAAAVPAPGFVEALNELVASLPGFVVGIGQMLSDLLLLLAIAVVATAMARRRWPVARDVVLAGALAAVLWILIGRSVEGSWPDTWNALRDAGPPPWYPSPRVAVPVAIVMTASPHLTVPFRRFARWSIVLALGGVVVAGGTTAVGAAGGLLIALTASSAVHLAFGSSAGRPSLDLVGAALDELGVPIRSLGVADRQQAGFFHVSAIDERGDALVVKVYGRDAHDAAVLSTLWRTVWYREAGAPLRFRRLDQVEHEAFMTLFAGQAGIATDTVAMAGVTEADDALLVLRPGGTPLLASAHEIDVVPAVWELVDQLHAANITHGQLDARHLIVAPTAGDDDRLGLSDFRGATIGRSELRLRTDEVQALVTTALLTGPEVAVAGAVQAIGPDRVAAIVPVLQSPALTPRQRDAISELDSTDAPWDLAELREAAAAAVGIEAPELRQLRRVTIGTILRVVLPAIALFFLISGLAGLDFEELVDQLGSAAWWLIIVGFFLAQTPRLTQAISTLGAAPLPLPLGPVYALQLAISYINMAIPSTAARVALNIRFFQRHGVPAGAAMAAGALDGFTGLVVEALLLIGLLVFTSMSLNLAWGSESTDVADLAVLVVVIVVVAILVVAAIGRLRRFVVEWTTKLGREAWSTVRGLRSMRRVGMLVGGNVGTEVLFAFSLGIFAQAFGYSVGLGELLVINISVALLSGLIPIPGGVGVAEGGLTFGLIQAGMPEEAAFAAVMLYRLATFYTPPVWGYFAMRWLERNQHL